MLFKKDFAPCDVIIVLGARVKKGGLPSHALQRRVTKAVALWEQGVADRILMTGGVGQHPPAEAVVMQNLALLAGVGREQIFMETKATTTLESGRNCTRITAANHWRKAVIVTDPFHVFRSTMTFRAFGLRAYGCTAEGGREFNPLWKWIYFYIREFLAIIWYAARHAVLLGLKKVQRQ